MEADFSGYATKAGLKCTDGRTIMPDAFKHQDKLKVPLVWQHGHKDPENVLGHAILENRSDGVYAYGFFNKSAKAEHARGLVEHDDINMLSIWANELVERAGRVLHGAIREVSLVLSGANPGALIENVTIRHSDGDEELLDEEAIIYTGLELEHSHTTNEEEDMALQHAGEDETVKDIYDTMDEKQQEVLHFMIGQALEGSNDLQQDNLGHAGSDETVQDVYDSMTDKQKEVLHYMLGQALEDAGSLKQDNIDDTDDAENNSKGTEMKHNVFESGSSDEGSSLSHDDITGIISDATRGGSLKDAVADYALAHGITDIDTLFPDAVALDSSPEWLSRRVEWVSALLGAVRKSPFSRIKTISADLTFDEARAKGYVKGALKKEEFFGVTKRQTTPTTIYKKQALDRDDVVDITDFDVVVWLKGEMRLMLDEELARAILIGDGRDVSHEDKINEGNIRPIAKDHELYVTTVNVNIDDASSSVQEVVDAVVANRRYYKGTGLPTMYTSETFISMFLLLKDTLGRRIYKSLEEVASELRVSAIVPVEAMEEETDLVAIIVNPVDYVVGANAGGAVNMFDDFDIDYNKQKYLIETRVSGALTKLKSAIVVRKVASTDVLVVPATPGFVDATGVLTITDQTGVVYKNGATVVNAAGSPYAAIVSGTSITIDATPASGYYFSSSENDSWTFTRD